MTTVGKQRRVLISLGVTRDPSGLMHGYVILPEGANLGTFKVDGDVTDATVRYWKKPLVQGRAGQVIEADVTVTKDGTRETFSVTTGPSIKWLGMWHEADKVTEWQATSDAARAADRADKDRAKRSKQNDVFEALAPVRRAYTKLDPVGRAALLAAVVCYVQRGYS